MHCIGILESLVKIGLDLNQGGEIFGFLQMNRNSGSGWSIPTGRPVGDPEPGCRLGTGLPVGGISRTLVLANFEIFRVLP